MCHKLEPLHVILFCVLNLMFCCRGYRSQLQREQPELTRENSQPEIPYFMIKTSQLSVLLLVKSLTFSLSCVSIHSIIPNPTLTSSVGCLGQQLCACEDSFF